MNIRNLLIIIPVLCFISSCNSRHNIELYKSSAQDQFEIIMGHKLHAFFDDHSYVKKYKLNISEKVHKKLQKIKDSVNHDGHILEIDSSYIGGIWDYAIIFSQDTLYASFEFRSWRYKNRVLPIPNEISEAELLKNNN